MEAVKVFLVYMGIVATVVLIGYIIWFISKLIYNVKETMESVAWLKSMRSSDNNYCSEYYWGLDRRVTEIEKQIKSTDSKTSSPS